MENSVTLEFKHITKIFPGVNVRALSDVSFQIHKGEIHALVGENGAGKSTLLNILQGNYRQYEGQLIYNGKPVQIKGPSEATQMGINMVHQELNLVPELTAGQNLFLGYEPRRAGTPFIDWNKLYEMANAHLEQLNCSFDAKSYVKDLSSAQMQMIEIAQALMHHSNIIAFDEPTATLTNKEIEKLFEIITNLKEQGTSIIYVSHRINEVFEIADQATVLRDGKCIGTYPVGELDRKTLVQLIAGKELAETTVHNSDYSTNDTVLEVKNLCKKGKFNNISFQLKKGEILGIAGLVGAGRTEIAQAIFGIDKFDSGEILLNGRKTSIRRPSDAVKNGIALMPEERKSQGLVISMPIAFNICLASLKNFTVGCFINFKKIKNHSFDYIRELQIKATDPETSVGTLSGGNQQKVVLAKWLTLKSDVIIFDEPTRGIDIEAKAEIYKLMNQLAEEGKAIIMISSELSEIVSMSDRVLIIYEGEIKAELSEDDITEKKALYYIMGGK